MSLVASDCEKDPLFNDSDFSGRRQKRDGEVSITGLTSAHGTSNHSEKGVCHLPIFGSRTFPNLLSNDIFDSN